MATEKQIAANRRNAVKSTGPRTPEGKAKVSKNALTHGLLSRDILIPGEDAEELAAFRQGMVAELAPEGALEWLLADRVVAAAWRLRRATRLERDVVEERLAAQLRTRQRGPERFVGEPEVTAARVAASTVQHTDTFGKIARYEAHIERGMYRALHELQRRQAARRGRQVTPPMVVDVNVHGLAAPGAEHVFTKQSQSDADQERPTTETPRARREQVTTPTVVDAHVHGLPAHVVGDVSAKQSQSESGEDGATTETRSGPREEEPQTDTDEPEAEGSTAEPRKAPRTKRGMGPQMDADGPR